jgi:hypothetical protein
VAGRHSPPACHRPDLGTLPARPITAGCSARRPGPRQRRGRSTGRLGGGPAPCCPVGGVDRRHTGVGGPPPRSSPATCDPPDHLNSATPPDSSNINSTRRHAATDTRTESHWRHLLAAEAPSARMDPFLPVLTERLSDLARAGYDATHLLRSAAGAGPLPDDHPAAALWWLILYQLPQTQPTTPKAVPATRRRAPTLAVRRSWQPPTFGASR